MNSQSLFSGDDLHKNQSLFSRKIEKKMLSVYIVTSAELARRVVHVKIKLFYDGYARLFPASILYKSTAGRYRPVSYPDGPITARYRFIKNAYWVAFRLFHCFGVSLLII